MNEWNYISNHDHSICTEGEGEAVEEEGVPTADVEEDSSPSVKFGDEINGNVPVDEEGMMCYPYIVFKYEHKMAKRKYA